VQTGSFFGGSKKTREQKQA